MQQRFKGQVLTQRKCVSNILKVYRSSSSFADSNWYWEANSYARNLATTFKVPLSVACGVIASLSPLKSWDENKLIAYSFLKNGQGKHTSFFVDKAQRIKDSNAEVEEICLILGGNKIISFFINLLEPDQTNFVTIDRHALSIAVGRNLVETEQRGLTSKQYDFFVDAYTKAGLKVGISPVLMQSITWQGWRENKKVEKNSDVPF